MSGRTQAEARLLAAGRRVRLNRVDDSGDVQTAQVESHGTPIPDVPSVMPYGLAANPPRKATGILTMIGGAWDNLVAAFWNVPGDRPKNLNEGDVSLYSGHAARVDLHSGGVDVTGNTTVDGTVDADGYKTQGAAGKTVIVTIPAPGGAALLTFQGGIYTGCSGTATEAPIGG